MKIVKQVFRAIEVLIFLGTSLYTGFKYGVELGIFVCGVMIVGFIFLNIDLFKSFGFGSIKAELLDTKEQVEQLNNFILVYLKNEVKALDEGITYSFLDSGRKNKEFTTTDSYDSFKRVYYLYKTIVKKSDKELENLIFEQQKKVLSEYTEIFDVTIQTYLKSYSRFLRSADNLRVVPQLANVYTILENFSHTRKIHFEKLDACFQELLKLNGDKAYLTRNWNKCVQSIKDITE